MPSSNAQQLFGEASSSAVGIHFEKAYEIATAMRTEPSKLECERNALVSGSSK